MKVAVFGATGGTGRQVVEQALAAGHQVPLAFKMLMRTVLKKAMADKQRQETLVKASDLDWTSVRPGGLTDGPATGQATVGTDPSIKAGQVSRADVAAFLLAQLDDNTYVHQAPAIT